MSQDSNQIKVKKDAAISALFALYRAAGDASAAIYDLLDQLESSGLDASDLKKAFDGELVKQPKNSSSAEPATPQSKVTQPAEEEHTEAEGETGDSKAKKPKRVRDPNAPKRPLNSFLRFRNQEQRRITQERREKGEKELTRDEMIALVRSNWENMPASSREEIEDESKADLERYHEELALYKAKDRTEADESSQSGVSSQSGANKESLTQSQSNDSPSDVGTQDSVTEGSSPTKRKSKKKDDKKKKKSKTE